MDEFSVKLAIMIHVLLILRARKVRMQNDTSGISEIISLRIKKIQVLKNIPCDSM